MCFVRHRELNLVKVMSTHGSEGPSAADVVVEFVLQVDERIVALHVKGDVTQDSCDDERSNLKCLWLHSDFLLSGRDFQTIGWQLFDSEIGAEGLGNSFQTEKVVPVCGNFNFIDLSLTHVDVVAGSVNADHIHIVRITHAKLGL